MRKVEVKGGKKIIPIRATAPALTTKPSPNKIKNITGGAPSFMNTVGAVGPRIYGLLSYVRFISYSKCFNWRRISTLSLSFGCLFTF